MEYLTIRILCEIAGVKVPDKFLAVAEQRITNYANKTFFVKKGGIFFCRGFLGNGDIATDADSEKEARIAYEKGAICIVSRNQYHTEDEKELPCIVVEDPLELYVQVCIKKRDEIKSKIVAITGSVGKTTTKEMMHLVAQSKFKTFASGPSSNDFATISQIIQTYNKDNEIYLQEVGGFSPGFVERSARILKPDICVLTKIDVNHIDLYGSKEAILKDKICVANEIGNRGGVAFLNLDDPLLQKVKLDGKIIWYSFNNRDADYFSRNLKYENGGIRFEICQKGDVNKCSSVKLNTYGEHNVMNALAAFAFGKYLGIEDDENVSALEKYKSKGIRQNLCNIGGYNMFIDCYNVSPDTVVKSVKTLGKIETNNKRIVALCDVSRIGDTSESAHKQMGLDLKDEDIDMYILWGKDIKYTGEILRSAGKKVLYTDDRNQLNKWLSQYSSVGDTIMMGGHHESHLDKSIDATWGTTFYFDDQDMVLVKGKKHLTEEFEALELDGLIQIKQCLSNAPRGYCSSFNGWKAGCQHWKEFF